MRKLLIIVTFVFQILSCQSSNQSKGVEARWFHYIKNTFIPSGNFIECNETFNDESKMLLDKNLWKEGKCNINSLFSCDNYKTTIIGGGDIIINTHISGKFNAEVTHKILDDTVSKLEVICKSSHGTIKKYY